MIRKSLRPSFPSIDLAAIEENNAFEEESKNIDNSKQMRELEERLSDRHSGLLKEEQSQSMLKTINQLKEENSQLAEEVNRLNQEIRFLEGRLLEKDKVQVNSFLFSLEGEPKTTELKHMQQIEAFCQFIAKELFRLEGD
jgi:predicted nuclease with TOPRIM domain